MSTYSGRPESRVKQVSGPVGWGTIGSESPYGLPKSLSPGSESGARIAEGESTIS